MKSRLSVLLFLLPIFLFPFRSTAQNTGFGLIIKSKYQFVDSNKKRFLPTCNERHTKNGNATPRAFGLGIHSFIYNQGYYGTSLQLTSQYKVTEDSIPVTIRVDSMYQNTYVAEMKGSIRPNVWILPFLNIYGIIGYTAGQVDPDIEVPYFYVEVINGTDTILSQRIDTSFKITDKPVFNGPSFGVGATFAIGFSRFFLIADYNYVMSNPLQVDTRLNSHQLSLKLGILFGNKSKQAKGALWAGAMCFKNDQYFSGLVDVRDIDRDLEKIIGRYVNYSGDVVAYPRQKWNFIFGGSWILNQHNNLSAEAGIYPRLQAKLSYNYSF
jgi:hypothetical protein